MLPFTQFSPSGWCFHQSVIIQIVLAYGTVRTPTIGNSGYIIPDLIPVIPDLIPVIPDLIRKYFKC